MKRQYTIKLNKNYINVIGVEKTIEGRLNRGIFTHLQKGDILNFLCDDLVYSCKLMKIEKYASFKMMLDKHYMKTIPTAKSIDEALQAYRRIYKERDEETYGVLALHVKRL